MAKSRNLLSVNDLCGFGTVGAGPASQSSVHMYGGIRPPNAPESDISPQADSTAVPLVVSQAWSVRKSQRCLAEPTAPRLVAAIMARPDPCC